MKRVLAIILVALLPLAGEQAMRAQEEHRALIVPVKFNDLQISTPAETLDSLAGELSKYYNAQFRDSINFVFDVFREVPVNGNYATFGTNQSFRRDALAHKMALTIYKTLYDQMDFSIYDNDRDGFVNDIILLTPGIPESAGGGEDQFWPQYIELESKDIPYSLRIRLLGFAIAPEMDASGKTVGISIMAHEFGHILGLKDLYDTDDDFSGGTCPGLGITSIMDHGLENDSGNTPPNLNAIEREILGTGRCVVLDSGGEYVLEPIHRGGLYFKLPTQEENRYYLIENRFAEGYDAYIGGSGMLIYKIDKSGNEAGYSSYYQRTLTALERWKNNQVNCNPEFPCASVVPAKVDTLDTSAVFWPKEGRTVFSPGGIALTDIRRMAGGDISFKALEPVRILEKMIYQTSATFIWTVSDELGPVDSCKFEWSTRSGPITREDGILSADGSYSFTIRGLNPRTTYNYKASVYYADGASYSSGGRFVTRNYRKDIFRFIYLGDAARNRDGSFQAGAAIPLVVYNCLEEEVSWTFDGKPVSPGPDGLWKIPGSGTLRAEITNEDGSIDVILKEIRVQ
ncbi:MAG: immune inhibitor A [Bacteroidales bacterium]|nr:immune inhibitor A [Bacteroidales bacterium]